MGRNLTNLYISQSFEYLVQLSGSELQNGLGSTLTGSLLITASKADSATSASYALTASYFGGTVTSASYAVSSSYSNAALSSSYAATATSSSVAINATSASYAATALSSSYAITASYALNAGATISTASLLTTASATANVITFTKGDSSTFNVTVATGSAVTVNTGSLLVTASISDATTTFTKGDGSTFSITANNVVNANSASVATTAATASYTPNAVTTASVSSNTITFTKGDGTTFPITVNTGSAVTVNTGSLLVTASISNATTTFTKGDGSTFSITANNVVNADSASVATSASYALTASYAQNANINTGSLLLTASATLNTITFTKGDGTTFPVTVNTGSAAAFPYTGSAQITGSLSVTGSNSTNGRLIVSQSVNDQTEGAFVLHSNRNGQSLITMYEYGGQAYIKAPRPNGNFYLQAGGGPNDFIAINDASLQVFNGKILANTPTTVSSSLTVTGSVVSTLGFTGSLLGTASFANNTISASFATSASYAATASLLLGSIESASYAATASTAVDFTVSSTASINILTGNVTASLVRNTTDTYTSTPKVQQIVTLTQAEYNAIGTPDSSTLYIISGSTPISVAGLATTGSNTFIGNEIITGSLTVTGSSNFTGGDFKVTDQARNAEFDVDYFKVKTVNGTQFTGSVSSLNGFTGSLVGTASFANTAITASYVVTAQTASYYDLSSVTQNAVFSGSVRGEVENKTYTSNTASIDLSTGNFFTTTLNDGVANYINFSNILPGQTINLRVTNGSAGTGTVAFPSSVKQASGSAYTPTQAANAVDIVTFIAFDSTNLYLSNIKNFI